MSFLETQFKHKLQPNACFIYVCTCVRTIEYHVHMVCPLACTCVCSHVVTVPSWALSSFSTVAWIKHTEILTQLEHSWLLGY